MGCCLTSWFSKKQTALAISTTEEEYVSAGKACQQALWMKQDLIDYGIRLDNIPIMCDNKGAIDLTAKQSSSYPDFNLDDDNFEPLWASASQPFQPYSEGPSQPVEDDSPVEETIEEEIVLCKAWVAKSEDSVEGNGKKAQVLDEESDQISRRKGEDKRKCNDSVTANGDRIRPKVQRIENEEKTVQVQTECEYEYMGRTRQ
ncbi:hypothetical protein Tco_0189007 [Tanacetum coccineum]